VTKQLHLKHGASTVLDLRPDFPAAATSRTVIAAKPATRTQPPAAAPGAPAARGNPEAAAAIQKQAEAFVEAFHKGDAKAVAAFWAPDGDYTDQSGKYLKGRDAIEKAFTDFFAENKGLKVRIDSESLRFVTPDVALEEGVSEVFPPDGGPPSRARYSNVFVKKDGQWLLGSVKDSAFVPPSNYEHLLGLEWAIGEWASESPKGEVEHISLAWTETRNFIIGSFSTTVKNVSVGSAKQWIGWDPLAKRIRSWSFDDSGAFGEGAWGKEGDKWVIKSSTVLQDGKKATATYVIGRVDADTITLEAKDRTVDGNALPDVKEVKLKRMRQ
jgi:uncharacterized protein (TIGR02246 family)